MIWPWHPAGVRVNREQKNTVSVRPLAAWQRSLAALFSKAWVELSIGVLIVISVVLTLVIGYVITWFFWVILP